MKFKSVADMPHSIMIMDSQYDISYVDKIECNDGGFLFGMSYSASRSILIATKDANGEKLPISIIETTL